MLFNSLFKVLFIFRSLYLCAIGLRPVFSFRWNLPPTWSCIPKQLDSSKVRHRDPVSHPRRDSHPLWRPVPGHLDGDRARSILCKLQLGPPPSGRPDFKSELLPLHSPLLGQSPLVSFPPLIDMLKFSGYPCLIRGQLDVIMETARPATGSGPPEPVTTPHHAPGPDTVLPLCLRPILSPPRQPEDGTTQHPGPSPPGEAWRYGH
jgi:hypothetical protein